MASATRAVIKQSTMTSEMQERAIHIAWGALRDTQTEQDAAAAIKAEFEKETLNKTWHCFVGRNFACFVTYEASSFTCAGGAGRRGPARRASRGSLRLRRGGAVEEASSTSEK